MPGPGYPPQAILPDTSHGKTAVTHTTASHLFRHQLRSSGSPPPSSAGANPSRPPDGAKAKAYADGGTVLAATSPSTSYPEPSSRPGPARNRVTSAASVSSAARVSASSAANGASTTWPPVIVQVATARPPARAKGRHSPLTVTICVCGPVIGSLEAQPRSSGSNAPSRRGGGSAAGARSALAGSSASPSARLTAPLRDEAARASRRPT